MSVCRVYVGMYTCVGVLTARRESWIPWSWLSYSCELPDIGAGTWNQVLCKSRYVLLTAEPSLAWSFFFLSLLLPEGNN